MLPQLGDCAVMQSLPPPNELMNGTKCMRTMLQCISHTPLTGLVDPCDSVIDEINQHIDMARKAIQAFDPECVLLFAPDHYNGFFYDLMPSFCVGLAARAIGDFGTQAGDLSVDSPCAAQCAESLLEQGIDVAVSYNMQVDHGFAQPLEFLLGGIDAKPLIPIFVNGVAKPMPTFARAEALGRGVGRFVKTLDKRVLIIASGGLSHEPPVPELDTADETMRARLLGGGRQLSVEDRKARTDRVINAAKLFSSGHSALHPLNPDWDQFFMDALVNQRFSDVNAMSNAELSALAGKSTHESKTWMAGYAALAETGAFAVAKQYYRPVPEWICGFGLMTAMVS